MSLNEKMRSEDEQRIESLNVVDFHFGSLGAAQMKKSRSVMIQPRHLVSCGEMTVKDTDKMVLLHPDRVFHDR